MHHDGYIGRKMRLPKLKEKPAIIIAAFGSSSRAKYGLDLFRSVVEQAFPDDDIFWAYTSEIIRKKDGSPGLQEILAQVESLGFRRAVVQPLHVFPGTEYSQLVETCQFFPGLRIVPGETLLHRWEFIKKTLQVIEPDFLSPEEGLNIIALHGTPLAADSVNVVYLGIEHLLRNRYPNVITGSIEGIPDAEGMLAGIRRNRLSKQYKKVKITPMMYIAGLHAEEDLMGDEKGSWKSVLERMGFYVECSEVSHNDQDWFKGLAWYPEILNFYLERLRRAMMLAQHY